MPNWEKGLIALGINLILIIVLFTIIDIIDKKIIEKIKNREANSPLLRFVPIIIKLLKAVIIFIAITGLLQSQGYSVSSILAGFGIGGIAVGMAAKDALANIFGSLEILSDHAYKIGDYVKINGIEGYVEDINIRSTKIRDLDHFLISIPNNVAANSVITNVSRAKKRFLNITFGIVYSTDNEKIQLAQNILKETATEHKEIHNEFTVAIHDLGDSSINVRFRGYVKSGSYEKFLKIRGEFLGTVIQKFREAGIDFAFPSRSIYIESYNTKIEN
ncbi:MAG: mechanosensitive ion channel family protein [Muribaculaceae bacterium]|nr:mechanosensitive ion channel family protein [Muribaculaceae bacterium]